MRVSTAAICTLAALAARDMSQQAIASPVPSTSAEPPQSEDIAVSHRFELPAHLVSPTAPESIASVANASSVQLPQFSSQDSAPVVVPTETAEAVQETNQAALAVAPVAPQSTDSPAESNLGAVPTTRILPPAASRTAAAAETLPASAETLPQAVSIPDSAPDSQSIATGEPSQADSASPAAAPVPQPTSEGLAATVNSSSDGLPDSSDVAALMPVPVALRTLNGDSEAGIAAQPQPVAIATTMTAPALETLVATTSGDIAQATSSGSQLPTSPPLFEPPSPDAIQGLQDQLKNSVDRFREVQFGDVYRGSPAITIANPSGFGADNFTGFLGVSFQSRTRFGNVPDASLGFGIGLGDAREAVGLQLSYTIASFGGSRDFGTGGFNAKLHHDFGHGLSAALGWEGFITTGSPVDFKDTIYGSVTQILRTSPDINDPFSRVALTVGIGNGRFRSESDVANDVDSVNVFGSLAVRIAQPLSAIAEWTGQDLALGLSIVPFRNIPFVLTPAVRDITGAGDGARFVMGAGISFQF